MEQDHATEIGAGERSQWIRLHTLVLLRWLAIIGQISAVVVASVFFDLDLRLDLCAAAIAASVMFNVLATAIHPRNKRLTETGVVLTLVFDLAQLSFLLFLTGGLSNPFSLLVLAPVTIAAATLSLSATLTVSAAAITVISFLVYVRIPLQSVDGTVIALPWLLVGGMWASLVIGIIFLAGYARRITVEVYSMSQALSATQMALSREQRLTALGGVVAAAAHELGTPLATIKLVSSELEEELQDRPELVEDVRLIRSQTERCRDILRDMGRSGRDDALLRYAPLGAIVAEAAEPHVHRGKRVIFRSDGIETTEMETDQPVIQRSPEIIHGIRNLVQNAVDFADRTVWVDLDWDDETLSVSIGDDGIGIPLDVMNRIGDPYVRDRHKQRFSGGARPAYDGMGLGLFIAKTLLERSGARLTFSNGKNNRFMPTEAVDTPVEYAQAQGALVEIVWKRSLLEADRADVRGPLGRNALNLP